MIEQILVEYYDRKKSIYEVAEALGTYPNRIRRELIKNGYELRTKQEAQTLAISKGRSEHPTKGKTRSEETRNKISREVSRIWEEMTEEDRQKRVEDGKKSWDNKTEQEKVESIRKAHDGVRKASKEGSRLERIIRDVLLEKGYSVSYHHQGLLVNQKMEVDMYMPGLNLAIEVDGPSHFLPIWGQDKLEKQIKADQEKYGLLTSSGISVLRIKWINDISHIRKKEFLDKLLEFLYNYKVVSGELFEMSF